MRERRKREAGHIVFDYRALVTALREKEADGRKHPNKELIKMKKGPITYTSDNGTRYFKEHPFAFVDKDEANHLLGFKEDNFVYFIPATLDDVEDYYQDQYHVVVPEYISIDSRQLDHFLTVMRGSGTRFPAAVQDNLYAIGEAASAVIMNAIEQNLPVRIAKFMIDRTAIDIAVSPGRIELNVRGMSEGEAGHPPRDGGVPPRVSSPDVNLWLTHEYGVPTSGGSTGGNKDKGAGVTVPTSQSAGYGSGSPYVGEIQRIVRGLTSQLEGVLIAFGAIISNNIAADIIEEGTKGAIKIDRRASTALNRAGVSRASLATLAVAGVEVSESGQINLRGAAGRFVSGGGLVPTTIRGSGRSKQFAVE